ncbi:transposase [Streptomyces sp. NPDC001774]
MGSKYTKRYSDGYKRDAIALVRSPGRTVTDVARELGISPESLRGWAKKARAAEAAPATPAQQGEDNRDEELKRLRKLTVEQAKTIEILKRPPVRTASSTPATSSASMSSRTRATPAPAAR